MSRYALVGPLPPYRGGIAHFSLRTWRTLVDRDHEVTPVTFTRQYPGPLFPGTTQYETEPSPTPSPVHRWIDSIGPWSWLATGRRLRRIAPDAIVFNYWMPFFAPSYGTVLRTARRPAIGLIHNAIPHERRPGDRPLGAWFLRRCAGCVVLSAEVERDLRTLGVEAPIRRIHHPIYDHFGEPMPRDEARRRLGLDPDRPLLLFFGYVRAYKGLDLLIDALDRLRARHPALQLVVAGEFYEDERAYREQIARLGLESRVHLRAGYVPDGDVPLLFSACDAVVQPYRTATQSGVAQVAYHFGRPMVLTDVGGLSEIVPHDEAGLVVAPGDVGALASALERLYEPGTLERLERGVVTRRTLFSWERLAEAIEDLTISH